MQSIALVLTTKQQQRQNTQNTKANPNTNKTQETHIKPNPKTVHLQELLISVHIRLCTIVLHNTVQNSSGNLPSYPPDNQHSSKSTIHNNPTTVSNISNEWSLSYSLDVV